MNNQLFHITNHWALKKTVKKPGGSLGSDTCCRMYHMATVHGITDRDRRTNWQHYYAIKNEQDTTDKVSY